MDVSLNLPYFCFRYTDSVTSTPYNSRVAFQVLIAPGSYEQRKETIGATCQIDPAFSNEELEWATDKRGSTILYGLLIRLDVVE